MMIGYHWDSDNQSLGRSESGFCRTGECLPDSARSRSLTHNHTPPLDTSSPSSSSTRTSFRLRLHDRVVAAAERARRDRLTSGRTYANEDGQGPASAFVPALLLYSAEQRAQIRTFADAGDAAWAEENSSRDPCYAWQNVPCVNLCPELPACVDLNRGPGNTSVIKSAGKLVQPRLTAKVQQFGPGSRRAQR